MYNTCLNLPIDDEDSLLQLQGASVSYLITEVFSHPLTCTNSQFNDPVLNKIGPY